MVKIISFWFFRMLFFTAISIYDLFIICVRGNSLTFDVIFALLFLMVISVGLAFQSLDCLLFLIKKD